MSSIMHVNRNTCAHMGTAIVFIRYTKLPLFSVYLSYNMFAIIGNIQNMLKHTSYAYYYPVIQRNVSLYEDVFSDTAHSCLILLKHIIKWHEDNETS